jgi:lipoate-protein ligase A
MAELELIVQRSADPALCTALDGWLMERMGRSPSTSPALCVSSVGKSALALGRYHLAPPPSATAAVIRRLAGGRVWPYADGFALVSLVLPHRSALVSDDPLALAPHQVPNRCVRGILAACRIARIDAFYPGRDLITVGGRALGALAIEVDARGTLLFQAVLAVNRDFTCLAELLDAADPGGEIVARMWAKEETTSLARELRADVSFEDIADLLRQGFEKEFPIAMRPREITDPEWQEIRVLGAAECDEQWLRGRRRTGSGQRVTSIVQLGVLEAWLSLDSQRTIENVVFAGDFIANSPAIEALEQRLRSCALRRDSVAPVVEQTFSEPSNFILGIGKPSAITDLLLRAGEPAA